MASTPSASALSAVLRCRGKIWARNTPTKRPAPSVYSLGLAAGVVRDAPAERTGSSKESAWGSFLQGDRVVVGKRLTVTYMSADGEALRENCNREINNLSHAKLSQSPAGGAHSAAAVPGVRNALRHQVTPRLFWLPGLEKCLNMIEMRKKHRCATHLCKTRTAHVISEFPAGVLKVSITTPCLSENSGHVPSLVSTGWSVLKSTCLSLTVLMSKFMFLKLGGLCESSSSSDDAPQHLLSQEGETNKENDALQTNGYIYGTSDPSSTRGNTSSGQRITEDRPD
ncbi:uncharacterized protein V6R79_015961 [Siganus canaliculatus]